MDKRQFTYKPIKFIAITFAVTWICAFFKAYQPWLKYDNATGITILGLADFLESASPLLAALILWRKPLFLDGGIVRFIFGGRPRLLPYFIVTLLFAYQFLTFYIFGASDGKITITAFLSVWSDQILFGGGMEEGGWRGYLAPAFERKTHVVISVILVALIWAVWHLPYFFLPGTFLSGSSFPMYIVITAATAFTLTAIYKLTGSVLLCTLFHGWQNAIVMTIPPNMGHLGFLSMFAFQTVISIYLCAKPMGIDKQAI